MALAEGAWKHTAEIACILLIANRDPESSAPLPTSDSLALFPPPPPEMIKVQASKVLWGLA